MYNNSAPSRNGPHSDRGGPPPQHRGGPRRDAPFRNDQRGADNFHDRGRGGGFGRGGHFQPRDGASSFGKRKAGNMRNQAKLLEYKKFLPLCMDKRLRVKLTCERFVTGVLEGYDPLDNLTLANCVDVATNEQLGTVMIRGSAIERIEALDDMDEKPNFLRLGVKNER